MCQIQTWRVEGTLAIVDQFTCPVAHGSLNLNGAEGGAYGPALA